MSLPTYEFQRYMRFDHMLILSTCFDITNLGRCDPSSEGRHDLMEVNSAGTLISGGRTRLAEQADKLISDIGLPAASILSLNAHIHI